MRRPSPPILFAFAAGLVLGALVVRPPGRLEATGAVDTGSSLFLTGPVALKTNPAVKMAFPTEALYYLDYRKGRLLATVPNPQQVGANQGTTIIGGFASRDLIADFQMPPGITPHFLMQVPRTDATVFEGWAPLVVLETTTGRVASYKVSGYGTGPNGPMAPKFDLLELKSLPE